MKLKRTFALLLALVMCLSLCACGSGKGSEASESQSASDVVSEEPEESVTDTVESSSEEKTIYNLGDTIETELFKITPSFTGFAKELANWPDENYMTPDGKFSGNSPYCAGSEKVEVYGEVQIEYIGNEKSNVSLNMGVSADYDDGYVFDGASLGNCASLDGDWSYSGTMTFEPLSSNTARILRYCIAVPEQVETNSDKALLVTFFVNGEPFTFDFRSTDVLGSDYDPRAEFYQPVDEETKGKIVNYLKENGLSQYGWYDKTFGVFTFTFDDTAVSASLPINSSYQYDFTGTYEVFSGAILISWDYGEQMHLDYTFDGNSLEIIEFAHDR